MFTVIGLGNPGSEYENTRHNAGRMAVLAVLKKNNCDELEFDKKRKAVKSECKIGKNKILGLLPETYMNKSGNSVAGLKPKDVILLHDDLDLPLGNFKISFGRGSGGHKGVESVMRAIKSKDFIRIRIGISPKKKPDAKKIHPVRNRGRLRPRPISNGVNDFILKKFSPKELEILKKVFKKTSEAIEVVITDSLQKAMNLFN